MNKLDDIITDSVFFDLCRYIEQHHMLYEHNHVSSTYAEELLYKALKRNKFICNWQCGSHKPGTDITVFPKNSSNLGSIGISCKGGTESLKALEFSGSRTTKQKTIEDKLLLLSASGGDVLICLVCDRTVPGVFSYKLHVIDSSRIDYSKLIWNRIANKWVGAGIFSAEITDSMSAQVWTTIPKSFIHKTRQYVVDLNQYNDLESIGA